MNMGDWKCWPRPDGEKESEHHRLKKILNNSWKCQHNPETTEYYCRWIDKL